MASIMVVLTFVAFGMAWRNIMMIWEGTRQRRISELLTTPLGVAGAAGAMRAVFPADSPLQTHLGKSFLGHSGTDLDVTLTFNYVR